MYNAFMDIYNNGTNEVRCSTVSSTSTRKSTNAGFKMDYLEISYSGSFVEGEPTDDSASPVRYK